MRRPVLPSGLVGQVLVLVLVLVVVGCGAGEDPPDNGPRMAAWLEFVKTDELAGRMAQAAEYELDVHTAVIRGEHDREFVRTACEQAQRHRLGHRLWPLLPEDEGYWPNQANHATFRAWVDELLGWAEADCPGLDGIMVDMEMPLDKARVLAAAAEGGGDDGAPPPDMGELVAVFVDGVDEAVFAEGKDAYRDLCAAVKGQGLTCNLTTLPVLVDDRADGDETLALALWCPVEGIDWDELSFQVYRSLLQRFSFALPNADPQLTAGIVSSYAQDIVKYWPERGAADLGTTSGGVFSAAGISTAAELQADIAATLAAGIPADRINIYSLEGLDEHPDPADWVVVPAPVAASPGADDVSLREFLAGLDALVGDDDE